MNLLQALIWMSLMLEISLASITSPSLFQEALQTDIEKRQATRTFHTTPDLPTQTGIPANCNKYYDVVSGDTCSAVETSFAITHPQFLAWNPAVSSDCTVNFWVGDSYCVGVSTSTTRPYHTTPDLPTQTGIPANCNKYYDVVSGDTCSAVEQSFGITHAQFLAWNPAVSSDCTVNFWVGDSYCVGVSTSSTRTGMTRPDKPTQTGISGTCNLFYDVITGDTCSAIEQSFDITHGQFIAWNPAVSFNCTQNFWVGDSYCVGVSGSATTRTAISTPDKPTQTGIPSTCNKWYDAVAGDTCALVAESFSITTAQFLAWNPAISPDCTRGFLLGDSYCVGISGVVRSTYSPIGATSTSYTLVTKTVATTFPPQETQTGQPLNCNNWYLVRSSDTCQAIIARHGSWMSSTDFYNWNPAVKSDCSGLYSGFWVCVGITLPSSAIITSTATDIWFPPYTSTSLGTESVPSLIPSPTQAGFPPQCLSFYQAQNGETCDQISQDVGFISVPQLEIVNPALGSDCSGIQGGYYYCIANGSLPTPSVVKLPPSPTQTGIVSNCAAWFQLPEPGIDCGLISQMFFNMFSQTQFIAWNPAVGSSCNSLIVSDYYCVSTPGVSQTSVPYTSTATTVPSGVPSPVQPGIIGTCTQYWYVATTDTCSIIASANGVTVTNLETWNPALTADCSGLTPGYFICVAAPGSGITTTTTTGTTTTTTTNTTPPLQTPTPTQPGMVTGCRRFYLVQSGDGCYNIAQEGGIALNDFYAWNPSVGTDCSTLFLGYYVCIGITGSITTITTDTPVPALHPRTV